MDVVQTLCDLVSLPSVNPMGRNVQGDQYLEYRVTEYLERFFSGIGAAFERITVEPRRDNIIARIDGPRSAQNGGRLLMFEVHQDTVPVEGMTIEPWTPLRRDGRIYGRGACDIKGGMASMLAAFERLAAEPEKLQGSLLMACSVNEEFGFTGATDLVRLWESGESKLLPRMPDAIIVAEPTSLDVVVAHKGVSRWLCRTRGKAVHSSRPELGENAICKMGPILSALDRYQKEIVSELGEHPLVGRPTLSVGVISGGISVNTVPDECVIQLDRRLLPGEDPDAAVRHVHDFLVAEVGAGAFEFEMAYLHAAGLPDDNNDALAVEMCAAAKRQGVASKPIGVLYGTDAAAFGPAGASVVVFGPGDIGQAHTVDEWVEEAQLSRAADILYEFATHPAGG